jgi:hypothetical protein
VNDDAPVGIGLALYAAVALWIAFTYLDEGFGGFVLFLTGGAAGLLAVALAMAWLNDASVALREKRANEAHLREEFERRQREQEERERVRRQREWEKSEPAREARAQRIRDDAPLREAFQRRQREQQRDERGES